MPCGTLCLGLPTSVLTVIFTTLCAEWIHKTRFASHTGGRRPTGYALSALDYLRETKEGVEPLLFFVYGRPNQERTSPPLLTVLLLLTGDRLEELGGVKNESDGTSEAWELQGSFFVLCDRSTFVLLLRIHVMDLLKACDEMRVFIETAQKLVDTWDTDPDNYSQLQEGLTALKAALEK